MKLYGATEARMVNLPLSGSRKNEEDIDDSQSIVTSFSTGTTEQGGGGQRLESIKESSSSSRKGYSNMVERSRKVLTQGLNQVITLVSPITGNLDTTSFGIGVATGLLLAFGILPLFLTILTRVIDFIRFSLGWVIVLSVILSVKKSQIGSMVQDLTTAATSGISKYSFSSSSSFPSSADSSSRKSQEPRIKRSKSSTSTSGKSKPWRLSKHQGSSRVTPTYDSQNDVLIDNVEIVSSRPNRPTPESRRQTSPCTTRKSRQPSPLRHMFSPNQHRETPSEYPSSPLSSTTSSVNSAPSTPAASSLEPHHKKVTLRKGGDQYSFKLVHDTSSIRSPSPALSHASSMDYFTSKQQPM